MRLLFDQNISHRILAQLPASFADSISVKQIGLINAPDRQIWEYAKKNNLIIVTQDSDFNDLNVLYGIPPKIIWIRTGNLKTSEILRLLIDHLDEIEQFILADNLGCFEIVRFR
jgi:predicted nuclease of predicted toxin-antitoxin system